jgi:hypothetical protein
MQEEDFFLINNKIRNIIKEEKNSCNKYIKNKKNNDIYVQTKPNYQFLIFFYYI